MHRGLVTLVPLRAELVDLDTAAYVASPDAIAAHSAGRWPVDGFTRETNLGLLAGHEREHDAGEAFAYAILDAAGARELGCVYLRRLDEFLARTGTVLEGVPLRSAIATFWLVDDASVRPAALDLVPELVTWWEAWAAAPPVIRVRPAERESVDALLALGWAEITARHQPLAYRWFRPPGRHARE